MFTLGRRASGAGGIIEDLKERLRIMLPDPLVPTVPLWMDMDNVGVQYSQAFSSLERFHADMVTPSTVPMEQIESWVQTYVQRQRWDFAWLLVHLMYHGSLDIVDMNMFQWQGTPGASRLWIWRDGVLLPTPIFGPVRTILGNWFGLSGGFHAPGGIPMNVDIEEFLDDWISPCSPVLLDPPSPGKNAYDVLDMIGDSFHDTRAYPKASLEELHLGLTKIPDTEIRHGVVYVRETPLARVRPHVRGEGNLISVGYAWDVQWLESQRDRVPKVLYQQAHTLRVSDL